MSYLMLWKIISFVMLIEGCLGCQIVTDRTIEEVLEENNNSPWLVFIVDQTLEALKTQRLAGLAYGSLIHPRLVLTAAYPLADSEMENLVVQTNCTSVKKQISCVKRTVSYIFDSVRAKKKEKTIEDWIVLVLKEPFVLSKRINVINLVGSDDKIYDKTCQIYHWQIVSAIDNSTTKEPKRKTELLHFPYNVTLNANKVSVSEEDESRMAFDIDCLISSCYVTDSEYDAPVRRLSFMGSPIVCQLEDGTPVQVGFTSIVYETVGDNNSPARPQSGGFVRFASNDEGSFTNIMHLISENR